jgi:prepilin-type N-terminal cleavage/methylation domain-containing protein
MRTTRVNQRGFSLLEMMVSVLILTVITGAVFQLLNVSQQRNRAESQVLDAFQSSRLALDTMTRDIRSSGYPPANAVWASVAAANPQWVALPFGWSPNYPATPCTVGTTCNSPTGFDLILEGNISPSTGAGVQWIRYQLQGATLMRGVVTKTAATDPATATSAAGVMLPYVDNVMNNTTLAQMSYLKTSYPALFPGNTPVPVFTYVYESGQPQTPPNIREVNIVLLVLVANPDPVTNQPRLVTLTGRALRLNPSQ